MTEMNDIYPTMRIINQKLLLRGILELRTKADTGLNNDVYKHIKPGQDAVYIREIKELLDTYIWIKGVDKKDG